MKIGIFTLRSEYPISGERNSTLSLISILRELSVEIYDYTIDAKKSKSDNLRLKNLFDFSMMSNIKKIINKNELDYYIVKLPTIAQLPIVSYLAKGKDKKIIIILDSVNSDLNNFGSLITELRYETFLAILKRLLNHSSWAYLSKLKPRFIIASSNHQINIARNIIGDVSEYRVISNSSPKIASEKVLTQYPNDKKSIKKIGYLGHAYAFKGCLEVIQAKKYLPQEDKYEFFSAFSPSGSNKIKKIWKENGGKDMGIVSVDEFFNLVDVVCVPLYYDFGTKVFPNVILEAMRYGIPIIATSTPVINELLGDNYPLKLLNKVSGKDIAKSIIYLNEHDITKLLDYMLSRYKELSDSVLSNKWNNVIYELNDGV